MDIFKLYHHGENRIVIRIEPSLTNFDIALNPFLSKEYDYISISKNKAYDMVIVRRDGSTEHHNLGPTIAKGISPVEDLLYEIEKFLLTQGVVLKRLRDYDTHPIQSAELTWNNFSQDYTLAIKEFNGTTTLVHLHTNDKSKAGEIAEKIKARTTEWN